MPELPEVETSKRGIAPHLIGHSISDVIIRESRLRWPIDKTLSNQLSSHTIINVTRRGKYILIYCDNGCVILHLGMSGSLRILSADTPVLKHDHIDIVLEDGHCLRYNDPRRFGACLWTTTDPLQHKLLKHLGPEPLTDDFMVDTLFKASRNRSQSVKTLIMDSKVVVGVGNIYANEALFLAGIRPTIAARRISHKRYAVLTEKIKFVLQQAIEVGGTTLRDFVNSDGKPGYFQQTLNVYGRCGLACKHCDSQLKEVRLGQRSTIYCPQCQS